MTSFNTGDEAIHLLRLVAATARIEARLDAISARMDAGAKRMESHAVRISSLELSRSRLVGAWLAVSAAVGMAGAAVWEWLKGVGS